MRKTLLVLTMAVAAIVGACSSAASSPSAAPASPAAVASAAPSSAASPSAATDPYGMPSSAPATSAAPSASAAANPASGSLQLSLADSKLGKILVDGQGRTLYGFTDDNAGTSTCYTGCAPLWPALIATGTVKAGAGLDAEDFTSFDRTDGTGKQVRFYAWPVYYYAGDNAAGDTNGQGLFGKWYVIGADGKLIK